MLRRILFVLFTCVVLLAGLSYFILTSPVFLQWLIPHVAAQQETPWQITTLKISKQRFVPPGQLIFEDVRAKIKNEQQVYDIAVNKIDVGGLETILHNKGLVVADVRNLALTGEALEIRDLSGTVQIDLIQQRFSYIQGALMAASLKSDPYHFKKFSMNFWGDASEITAPNFGAQAYDGILSGNLRMILQPKVRYDLILKLKGVDFKTFAEEEQAPLMIVGKVSGELALKGNLNGIHSLQTNLDLGQGGKMKGELLSFIVQYLPSSVQKTKLEGLISSGGMVVLERGSIQLKSLNQTTLSGIIKLFPKELNLDINAPIDIHLDEKISKLDYLLRRWAELVSEH